MRRSETKKGPPTKISRYLHGGDVNDFSSIKDINYTKILNLIHSAGPISRAEIARSLNLSKTTITPVIRHLLKADLVREVGKGESKSNGGRKPLLLEFNKNVKVIVGIEIGDKECIGIITDLYANPIGEPVVIKVSDEIPPGGWRGRVEILETIRLLTKSVDPAIIIGVCIGFPGIVDYRREIITITESLGLEDFSLKDLKDAIPYPVRVINRANAAALGEKWHGAGEKVQDLIYVSIEEGIGSGIIINNNLLVGRSGSAGEIGHTTVIPSGPLCRCGSNGCLESLVSNRIIVTQAKELALNNRDSLLRAFVGEELERIDLKLVVKAAKEGDSYCEKLLRQQGEYIGIALANAVNLFDPQLIVLGGETGMVLGEYLLPTIVSTLRQRARYFKSVEVTLSSLGRLAGPIGASAFLLS